MSLPPTLSANYTNSAVINTLNDGVDNFTTEQDGQGLKIINNTTSGYLEISSAGAIVSPDGVATYPINFKDLSAITTNTTPQELVVVNTIAVQDATTTPPNNIQIQAGVIGVGTNFGIEYSSSTDQDFTIFCDENNTGGVLYKQQGFGATTTQTKITQGTIVSSDTASGASNTIQPTSVALNTTSGEVNGSYTGNSFSLQYDGAGSSVGSGGISASISNQSGTIVSQIGGGVANLPTPPFPASDANWSINVDTTTRNPQLTFQNSAPFENSTSMTLDLNGLTHNQGTGSPSPNTDFTISTNKNLIITSDNFNVSASSMTIPAIGQPITAQITQDGLTCSDTTSNWSAWYRKSSAYISNTAGTIYSFIQNGIITLINSTINSQGVYGAESLSLSKTGAENGSAVLLGYGRLTNTYYGGGYTDYLLQMINANTGAGNTTGVVGMLFQKTGRNGGVGDIIMSQQYRAKNYLGTDTQFGKIESVITSSSAGAGDDGALDFYTCVNGTSSLVMRLNGADNENNTFRPFDLNGNALKTSSGNMTIDTTGSSGSGILTLSALQSVIINSNNLAGIQLNTSGGNLAVNTSTAGLLTLTGTALQSASAGGSAGTHLCITLNGTPYKIALLNV